MCCATLAMLFSGPATAMAGTILYYSDFSVGTDRMAQALANPLIAGSHSVTTVGSSAAFQTAINTGNYDLGIFFAQNQTSSTYASAINALGNHVAGGGLAIYADWSRNDGLSAQFGATFGASTNQTQMNISDAQIGSGLVNPVDLFNPGWGVFSTGLDLTSYVAATFGNGEGAIVVGNSGRSIVNGFLNDTFVTAAEGQQLYINEIQYAFGQVATPVPEPASMTMFGIGGLGLLGYGWRRKKAVAAT